MTPDEQRIAIAKLLGVQKYYDRDEADFVYPDYVNDLNLCHEFEKTLRPYNPHEAPWLTYRLELLKIAGTMQAHATAAQRCEAFLRTKGKWKA